ncbi:unnamed protein product [Echinostoma caproni]|uniref:Uncharacterized protein n=1 Tax=Echinostoma caproni TaxID=27848 RepID=A0A183AYL0_9TREM|nr:unnamed protein product [Echinostoma caproni]
MCRLQKETVSSAASGSASSSTATSASIPTSVRIRPATLIAEPSLGSSPMESGAQSITLISSLSSAATLVASNQHSSTAPPITTSTGTSGTLTADPNASRINKRTRVAFFNIFDATSPSSMSTSKSSPAVNNGSVRAGSLTGTTSVSASLSQTTVFTASPVSTVPSTGKPVTTTSGAIDLTGECPADLATTLKSTCAQSYKYRSLI